MMRFHRKRSERGAAAVEFALVLPFLLLLVFGIIEFGFIFNRYISVTHAAREGVRELSVGISTTQAQTDAVNSAPNTGGTVTCTATETTVAANDVQESMACQTTYTYSYVPGLKGHTLTLKSTAKMRRE
jgi:Flp pilus assembly protein TadG